MTSRFLADCPPREGREISFVERETFLSLFLFLSSSRQFRKIFYRSVARAFKTRSSVVETLSRPLCLNRVTFTVPNFASAHARNSSSLQQATISFIYRIPEAISGLGAISARCVLERSHIRTIVNGNNSEIESSRRMTMSSFSSKRIFHDTRSRKTHVFYSDCISPLLYSRSFYGVGRRLQI